MTTTEQLINMLKFCTANRSMEEILLTAIEHYRTTYPDDKFLQAVLVASLQSYIPVMKEENDYKVIALMSCQILEEFSDYLATQDLLNASESENNG